MFNKQYSEDSVLTRAYRVMTDWFTLDNYEREKDAAVKRIVKRQSRGNVSVQNGWYMTQKELDCRSRKADEAMKSLRQAFSREKKAA